MIRNVDDKGVSLIELLIYILVLGVVMAGLATIFLNMWKTQATINAQTQATSRGQLVTSEIEKAMRNATGFQVADGGTTLLVQTSFVGSRQCQAFHFNPTGGANGSGTLQMVLAAAPAPAASSGYVWQTGIGSNVNDSPFTSFFTGVNTTGAPAVSGVVGAHYSFVATAPDVSTSMGQVSFAGTSYPRNSTLGGTSTCWP